LTISSTNRVAGPFTGNGTASTFGFTFKVFEASDLQVVRLTISTGVETTLTLTTDYTVSLNANQNTNPGGSVTLTAGALSALYTLTITSDIANLQPTDLTNQGGFYPEVITDALDRSTIQIQQISDIGDRSLFIPLSDGNSLDLELPSASLRASKYLTFNASGEPTVSSGSGTDTALRTDLADNSVALAGSSLVGFRQSSANSVARTVLTKLRESQSVKDYGAVGDGVADDTSAFTTAWTANSPNPVFIPGGSYAITGTVTGTFITLADVTIVGGTVNTITRLGANATIPGTLAVTGTSTLTGNATLAGDVAVNGGDITTTAATATVFDTNATTLNVGGAATTVALGAAAGTVSVGNLSMNAGYGSIAPVYGCRAWANIDGTTNSNQAATYSQSGTTVTVTLNNHGYLVGHVIYNDITSGTAVDGEYTITSVATNTFTYTAGTSLTTSGNCSLIRNTIRASQNVHSVTAPSATGTSGRYVVNFAIAMPDANYCAVCQSGSNAASNTEVLINCNDLGNYVVPTAVAFHAVTVQFNSAFNRFSANHLQVAVFR
jgi:hypothetical protein